MCPTALRSEAFERFVGDFRTLGGSGDVATLRQADREQSSAARAAFVGTTFEPGLRSSVGSRADVAAAATAGRSLRRFMKSGRRKDSSLAARKSRRGRRSSRGTRSARYRSRPLEIRSTIYQMESLGVKSAGIVTVTSLFIGMVMTIQFAFGSAALRWSRIHPARGRSLVRT